MMETPPNEVLSTGAIRQKTAGRGCYELISPFVLERDAKLYEWGAAKRGLRNWEKGIPYSRCVQSIFRHMVQFMTHVDDPDHHDCLAAVRFWAGALIYYEEMIKRGILPKTLDDLPRYNGVEGPGVERMYVAGPISGDTEEIVDRNYKKGQEIGEILKGKGHLVFVPHNYVLVYPGSTRLPVDVYEALLNLDLSIIRHWATAICFIGHSPGADRELDLAWKTGLKIFWDWSAVPDVSKG